ncbi:ankyrin repeat protein [Aureobasidium pullulans]|uniref:Ankyrin repeat protein n=1 Tax=Aureobasidium pullulans TaxID=5580 RepID=A0A4S8X067_AURPU|nr:ankyrin repeat protein [Aureobasidium pullulans]
MDPASVIGVIGVVLQITKTIYAYGDAVPEYKNEVARLRSELFGMHAALTQIEQDLSLVGKDGRHTLASPNLESPQVRQMLDETHTILEQLANTLQEDISRSRRLARRIIWPLKRPQIQDLATHLERLKSFFILATIRDTLEATRDIQLSIKALRQSIQDIQQSKEEQTLYKDAIRWLNPGDPQSIHTAASSARLDGTNSWFITGPFDNWVSGTSPLLWLNGKPGSGKTCLTAACVHNLPNAPDIKTLIDLFGQMTNTLNSTFFILIDGVDECGKNLAIVLRAIFQIATGGKRARLMLSSTENVAHIIQESISKSKLTPNTVSMDLGKVSGDINDYINTQFSQQPKLKMLRPIEKALDGVAPTLGEIYMGILQGVPDDMVCSDQEDLNARKQDWPLLEYASAFWTRHIRVSPQESGEHLTAFSRFAASSDLRAGGNFAAWYQVIYPQGNPRVWSTKPLYMCAREGLIEPLRTLLATCTKDQIEHRGGARGSTALHVAATYGETEAVKLLLAAGADPNEHNNAGENGIQWAALYDHTETVRLLLEAGALPDLLRPESNPELHEQMVRHSLVPSSRHLGTEGSGKPGSPKKLEAVS